MKGLARWYFANFIPKTLKKADHIIANSEATKKDLIRYLRIPSSKITAIHLGVGKEFLKESDIDLVNNLRRANRLTGDYLLSVASFEPRKNHAGILRGFAKALPDLDKDTKLALIGRENRYQYEIRALADELGIADRVAFTGYLEAKELAAMYQGASMLVFPSLDEGFGIPIIEAFAKGVPVLTSHLPATEEVAGNAARFVNPQRPDEIGQAIAEIYNDTELRASLVQLGKERVGQFSWEKNARETIRVYYRVLGRVKDLT
jgi:glycosyltransferase involved in cell wall biosynthesis